MTSSIAARSGPTYPWACERIAMSDHNALAWITTPVGPWS